MVPVVTHHHVSYGILLVQWFGKVFQAGFQGFHLVRPVPPLGPKRRQLYELMIVFGSSNQPG